MYKCEPVRVKKAIIDYIYIGLFGVLIFLFATGNFANITGTSLVVIDNSDPNSMFPTYFQGDLFVIQDVPANKIDIGDVVVYDDEGGSRVIHRIVDIVVTDSGEYFFRIKGDDPITNRFPDQYGNGWLIPYEQVLGKIIARIPFIGHISLAMQSNPAVQIILYMSAAAIAAAIIFLPEEEEDEEEYYDINRESISKVKQRFSNLKDKAIQSLFRSKYKKINLSLAILLLMFLILLVFSPLILPQPYRHDNIGIKDVEISNRIVMDEPGFDEANSVIYILTVHMYDQSSNFVKIKGYTLTYYDGEHKLGETIWETKRQMKGKFAVGGALLIDQVDSDTMSNDTTIRLELVLHIKNFFFNQDLEPFITTFNFDPPTYN